MKLMSSGGYYGRNTCFDLAEEWGIHWTTVRDDAAEAGRFLQLTPEEKEQRRAELSGWASKVAELALNTPNVITGLPDYRAALEANRLCAIWQGISDKVEADLNSSNGPKEPVKIEIVLAPEEKS